MVGFDNNRKDCEDAYAKLQDDGGKDWQATRMNGKICTVHLVDSIAQIHLEESGLALIPGVDEYAVIGE
jgi:hypothetical protein